jgi:hypothetical protein
MTFRPKNECNRCNYTWHPRGKNRSLKCPHCGCRDIIEYETIYTTDWSPVKFLLVGIVSLFIALKAQDAKNEFVTNLAVIGLLGSAVGFCISYEGGK